MLLCAVIIISCALCIIYIAKEEKLCQNFIPNTHIALFFLDAESPEKLQGATTVITQRSSIESFFFLRVENFIGLLIESLQTGENSATFTSAVVVAYGK